MKHLLYIFLVLATLLTGLYLLPKHTPLFEYYRLRPVFEVATIVFLIGVLCLYGREKRQVKMIFSRLSQKNFFLDLAIQCGGIYIWEFKDEEFFFKYPVGDQPSRIELEEMWKLIHPDDLIAFKLQRQSLWKADKEVFQCRARFTGSDYEWWEFRFSAMPAVDNAEGGKDVSGILININDMKKREKELILMRGYEQKFLANMSHEIRTPLNSIVGFSNLLASEKDLDEADKQLFAKTINQSCDLLLVLINDILEVSRLQSGQMKFEKESCSVKELVDDLYLGRDRGVIGAGQPQRGIALHAMIARGHVLQHRVQRVTHVQLAGYVWRRHYDGKGLFALLAVRREVSVLLPFAVELVLDLLRVPCFSHFRAFRLIYFRHSLSSPVIIY